MTYRMDTEHPPSRPDEHLADALYHHLATGEWPEETPELIAAMDEHAPMARLDSNDDWGPGNNLGRMAVACRLLGRSPGPNSRSDWAKVLLAGWQDQVDHGQVERYQLRHRGKIEHQSVSYAYYQHQPALSVWGTEEVEGVPQDLFLDLRMAAGRFVRRDLVLYALHCTPQGRISIAHGRSYAEPSVQPLVADAGQQLPGVRQRGLERYVAALLAPGYHAPLDGVSMGDLAARREYRLEQIWRVEGSGLAESLLTGNEARALRLWVLRREILAELLDLVAEIRTAAPRHLLAWTGGHASWCPTMSSYNRTVPWACAQGERCGALVHGAAHAVVRHREISAQRVEWSVSGHDSAALTVPEVHVEIRFGSVPPDVLLMGGSVIPSGWPQSTSDVRLWTPRRPGLSGLHDQVPVPPDMQPGPDQHWRPGSITHAELRGADDATRRLVIAAHAAVQQGRITDRLRRTAKVHRLSIEALRAAGGEDALDA